MESVSNLLPQITLRRACGNDLGEPSKIQWPGSAPFDFNKLVMGENEVEFMFV